MDVDIGELEERPTNKIPGFYEHLTELLPVALRARLLASASRAASCSACARGPGWATSLEHVALELQNLAGAEVTRGKTRGAGERGVYNVVYAYAAGRRRPRRRQARPCACSTTSSTTPSRTSTSSHELEEKVIRVAERLAYGPSTGAIVAEAERRGIPVLRLDPRRSLVQLGHGALPEAGLGDGHQRDGQHRRRHRRQQGADQPPAARGRHPGAARRASSATPTRPSRRRGGSATRSCSSRSTATMAAASASTSPDEAEVREAFPVAEGESRAGTVVVETLHPRQGLPHPGRQQPGRRRRRARPGPRRRRRQAHRRAS